MMAKKYFQKALSVGLSLTLCASLVAPALAASFDELNKAIKGEGYDNTKFNVTQDETGRTVKLLEEVKWKDEYGSVEVRGTSVTIDLNGNNIVGNGRESTIWVIDGGNLTLTDTNKDGKTGQVTNGGKSGVKVGKDGTFTMEGGEISGNKSLYGDHGGGVTVVNGGQFEMKGGVIQGNTSEQQTADVVVDGNPTVEHENDTKMEMTGGTLLGKVEKKEGTDKISASISGGTVSGDVDKNLLADKCGLMDNGDGTCDVVDHSSHIWGGWETVAEPQIGIAGVRERHCQVKGCTETDRGEIPALVPTPAPVVIDEPAVPLASGPVTQGEFVDYLWRHEGEPEGEPAAEPIVAGGHEYAPAINWAQSIGIISAETFEADELVTVALARDILAQFALYADMAMPELTTLAGEDDEAVLNCDEVLAEFFGEE